MPIILQRKLSIKAVDLIVHIRYDDTKFGAANTARLVLDQPNPRIQCGINALPNPIIR